MCILALVLINITLGSYLELGIRLELGIEIKLEIISTTRIELELE